MASGSGKTSEKKMPRGGRKGGAKFPRYSLNEALVWAKKLVSKTHSGPQPKDIIYSGVVGSKGGIGNVRISALRQYGLLEESKSGFLSSELARRIMAAPQDELANLYQNAVLHASVFKVLFNTFQGDSVTKSKLKQRVADLKVHPDETESCVDIYISGAVTANLATVQDDKICHISQSGATSLALANSEEPSPEEPDGYALPSGEEIEQITGEQGGGRSEPRLSRSPRAVFNVSVTLDSSLDIEKLSKQLELLRRFGAL
jgi:hypothetical protein